MVVTVGVFACLQVDNDRRDLDMNSKDVDAEKMTRFVRMNELRLVTEYNPVVITNSPQPGPWPPPHGCPLAQEFTHPDMCKGCGNGVGGVGEATQLFAAAPYRDWKPPAVLGHVSGVGRGREAWQFL